MPDPSRTRRSPRAAARVGAALLLAALPPVLLAGEPAPAYHVAARYEIGGSDRGYDYLRVDGASRRLFVTHGTRVEVLDADTGKSVGQLTGLSGAHGIEIVAERHIGFATSGVDRTVVAFDPVTLGVIKRIRYLGERPDALEFDPASGLLYVVNGGGTGDLSIIDPVQGAIVDTLELGGGKLEEIAFDGAGRGYVNDEEKNVVHVFDSRSHKFIADWPLAPAEGPTGLAIDRQHHRLFSACGNRLLAVLDSESGKLLETVTIGPEPDGAAFDEKSGRVFTSNRDGTLTVLGRDAAGHYSAQQTVRSASGARTIALDDKTGRLFLPSGRFGTPPAPTAADPQPRAPLVPESFAVIVVAP